MAPPTVTVCMPVYNGAAFLREAVASILSQSFTDFELLIIDDGSTDASIDILRAFEKRDRRVRVLQNGKNEGLVYTRNRAIHEALGRYIAVLDSDDIALVQRLSKEVRYLETHGDCSLVGSQAVIIDGQGRPQGRAWTRKVEPDDIPAVLLFNNCIAQSTVMARKKVLEQEPYRSAFPLAEDYDVWVRIARTRRISILSQPLVKYRVHSASISKQKEQQLRDSVRRIFSYQLADLGLHPSDQELDVHEMISGELPPPSRERILACERWLLKIKEANDRTGRLSVTPLDEVIARKWLLICGNAGLGRWALRAYHNSTLSTLAPASLADRIKLAVKCYTGITKKLSLKSPRR